MHLTGSTALFEALEKFTSGSARGGRAGDDGLLALSKTVTMQRSVNGKTRRFKRTKQSSRNPTEEREY